MASSQRWQPRLVSSSRSSATAAHYRRRSMRPVTAIVVIGLLVLIAGAFLFKLVSTGFTP